MFNVNNKTTLVKLICFKKPEYNKLPPRVHNLFAKLETVILFRYGKVLSCFQFELNHRDEKTVVNNCEPQT